MRDNPLLLLPNLCYLNKTLELLLDQFFICSWKMAFAKMMERMGKIIYSKEQPQCGRPSHLAIKDWAEIYMLNLIN